MSLCNTQHRGGSIASREIDLRCQHPCAKCGSSGVTKVKIVKGKFELYEMCDTCAGTGIEPERIE